MNLPPNTISRPYRGLSVQHVDFDLDSESIDEYLRDREIYRRTEFLLLVDGDARALVRVVGASDSDDVTALFRRVTSWVVLALPPEVIWIESPETDVGNATALARAAQAHQDAGALVYAVRGLYEHINFIWQPTPLSIWVTEVVPPSPAKLQRMAEQAIAFDEELPPIDLRCEPLDIEQVCRDQGADSYLLPCRGSGASADGQVAFLDTHPERQDWLLVGCERSAQIHEHFYGDIPSRVDLCPRQQAQSRDGERVLAKCCLLERGVELQGVTAVVPWGANLDEVRAALRFLAGLDNKAGTLDEPAPLGGGG